MFRVTEAQIEFLEITANYKIELVHVRNLFICGKEITTLCENLSSIIPVHHCICFEFEKIKSSFFWKFQEIPILPCARSQCNDIRPRAIQVQVHVHVLTTWLCTNESGRIERT